VSPPRLTAQGCSDAANLSHHTPAKPTIAGQRAELCIQGHEFHIKGNPSLSICGLESIRKKCPPTGPPVGGHPWLVSVQPCSKNRASILWNRSQATAVLGNLSSIRNSAAAACTPSHHDAHRSEEGCTDTAHHPTPTREFSSTQRRVIAWLGLGLLAVQSDQLPAVENQPPRTAPRAPRRGPWPVSVQPCSKYRASILWNHRSQATSMLGNLSSFQNSAAAAPPPTMMPTDPKTAVLIQPAHPPTPPRMTTSSRSGPTPRVTPAGPFVHC